MDAPITGGAPSAAPSTPNTAPSQNSSTTTPDSDVPRSPLNGQPVPTSPNAKKTETPQQAAARKMKLKIDGAEEEFGEDEVIKLAQMGRSADKRFQEAAKSRKEAENFLKMLKEDPISVLQNPAIGHDFRQLAEQYLKGQYEREMLSPEQQRIRDLEDKLKEKETNEAKIKEKEQQDKLSKLEAHYKQEFDQKIVEALSTNGLPRSPKAVNRMIDYMTVAIREGIDVEPKHVVNLVRRDFVNDVSSLFGQMEGDSLLQILGDGVANKIRKADLARLKANGFQPPAPKPTTDAAPAGDPNKPMNVFEWREEINRRVKE